MLNRLTPGRYNDIDTRCVRDISLKVDVISGSRIADVVCAVQYPEIPRLATLKPLLDTVDIFGAS
jgi:hypothetical protein